MSGYRNSGLSQEDYEDREALRAAVDVVRRRWPECVNVASAVEALSAVVGEEGDRDG